MGFFDKAKELAATVSTAAKSGIDSAKKAYDDKKAANEAEAYAKENVGLSPEEIIAKDDAKKLIIFKEIDIAAYVKCTDGSEYWGFKTSIGRKVSRPNLVPGGSDTTVVPYSDEPGLKVKFTNLSEKEMKYLYIGVFGKNKVGDTIDDGTFTMTGPFKPGKKRDFGFGYAFCPGVVEVSLHKVTIEYFDGEKINLEGRWINRLLK